MTIGRTSMTSYQIQPRQVSCDARERLLERVAGYAEQYQVFSSADMAGAEGIGAGKRSGRKRVDIVAQLLLTPVHQRLRLLRLVCVVVPVTVRDGRRSGNSYSGNRCRLVASG